MKKTLSACVAYILVVLSLSAQNIKNRYIIDENVQIITHLYKTNRINSIRFTPSILDVKKTDSIIVANKTFIRSQPRAKKGGDILRKSKKGFRQYAGILNEKGERMILVNFIDKHHIINDQNKKSIIDVIDGGNGYWQLLLNIDKNIILDIYINGSAR